MERKLKVFDAFFEGVESPGIRSMSNTMSKRSSFRFDDIESSRMNLTVNRGGGSRTPTWSEHLHIPDSERYFHHEEWDPAVRTPTRSDSFLHRLLREKYGQSVAEGREGEERNGSINCADDAESTNSVSLKVINVDRDRDRDDESIKSKTSQNSKQGWAKQKQEDIRGIGTGIGTTTSTGAGATAGGSPMPFPTPMPMPMLSNERREGKEVTNTNTNTNINTSTNTAAHGSDFTIPIIRLPAVQATTSTSTSTPTPTVDATTNNDPSQHGK